MSTTNCTFNATLENNTSDLEGAGNSTISTTNGNLTEYFVSYDGEGNNEMIMQTGSGNTEGFDHSESIYISTPPDVCVEHVSMDKDGNLILQTSSKTDGTTCNDPKIPSSGPLSQDTNLSTEVSESLYMLPVSSGNENSEQTSQNTFVTIKNENLLTTENNIADLDEKVFIIQPSVGQNVNAVLAEALNNNAELAALRQTKDNIVLNIITEDNQKLENVILGQNWNVNNGEKPLNIKQQADLDTSSLSSGQYVSIKRDSQQIFQTYLKPATSSMNGDRTRGQRRRRRSGRGRGRSASGAQLALREFHMEQKLMVTNFPELLNSSKQAKLNPIVSASGRLSASQCSKTDMIKAVSTDQNTIILTRSQPQQLKTLTPAATTESFVQISSPVVESVKPLSVVFSTNAETLVTQKPTVSVISKLMTKAPKASTVPKLVTTPMMVKTSDLKGVSHTGLQQSVLMKGGNMPFVSKTAALPGVVQKVLKSTISQHKTQPAKKSSNLVSTIVVIVPPSSKWGIPTSEIDTKEKPLLENPSIMFSHSSSSNKTMLYEIPAKIVKFQEGKPLQRKLPYHQDYLKVTKVKNEGEPIRPPGRFYKSRNSKKTVQISIPIIEKLPDGKGTKAISSIQQLTSMYPYLSMRLPEIAKLIDSSRITIPESNAASESIKPDTKGNEEIKLKSKTIDVKSSELMSPECSNSVSLYLHSKPEVSEEKHDESKESSKFKDMSKKREGNIVSLATMGSENIPSFCHSNTLRTYQELRHVSQKARSILPSKMAMKNVKQHFENPSHLIPLNDDSKSIPRLNFGAKQENSEASSVESAAIHVESWNEHGNKQKIVSCVTDPDGTHLWEMKIAKSSTLESVLQGIEIATPSELNNSAEASLMASTSKLGIACQDETVEQAYCHMVSQEKITGTHATDSVCEPVSKLPSNKREVSVLRGLYANKSHSQISNDAPLNEQNSVSNLMGSALHQIDSIDNMSDLLSADTAPCHKDIDSPEKTSHSQLSEQSSENGIHHHPASDSVDNLLIPQTSLSMKYHVQTSLARNLSAGLKTLDLDSFLTLSTDDDRDGSFISKELVQETVSKHEDGSFNQISSKCKAFLARDSVMEGTLCSEETASAAVHMEKLLTDKNKSSSENIKLAECISITSEVPEHTKGTKESSFSDITLKETNINVRMLGNSDYQDVIEMESSSENRNVADNVNRLSSCLQNDSGHEVLKTNSFNVQETVMSSENVDCKISHATTTDGFKKTELLSNQKFTNCSEVKRRSKIVSPLTAEEQVMALESTSTLLDVKSNSNEEEATSSSDCMDGHSGVTLEEKEMINSHDPSDESNSSFLCDSASLHRVSASESCKAKNVDTCSPYASLSQNDGENSGAEKSEHQSELSSSVSDSVFKLAADNSDTDVGRMSQTNDICVESDSEDVLKQTAGVVQPVTNNILDETVTLAINVKACHFTKSVDDDDNEMRLNSVAVKDRIDSDILLGKANNFEGTNLQERPSPSDLKMSEQVNPHASGVNSLIYPKHETIRGVSDSNNEVSSVKPDNINIANSDDCSLDASTAEVDNTASESEHSHIDSMTFSNTEMLKLSSDRIINCKASTKTSYASIDIPVEPTSSVIRSESISEQDDGRKLKAETNIETNAVSGILLYKDVILPAYDTELETILSQDDKQDTKLDIETCNLENSKLKKSASDLDKNQVLHSFLGNAVDLHKVGKLYPAALENEDLSYASCSIDSSSGTTTNSVTDLVLKASGKTNVADLTAKSIISNSSNTAEKSNNSDLAHEKTELDAASPTLKTSADIVSFETTEHHEISSTSETQGIPNSVEVDNSDGKINSTNVKNAISAYIASGMNLGNHNSVVSLPPNVKMLNTEFTSSAPVVGVTGLNVLTTKEATSVGIQGSNLGNINFLNIFAQSTEETGATGLAKTHMLGYANALLLLPAVDTQRPNLGHLNPAITLHSDLNLTESSVPTLAQTGSSVSLEKVLKSTDEIHVNLNRSSRFIPHNVYKSAKNIMEPLDKCEETGHCQTADFVLGAQVLPLGKTGQMPLEQTPEDTLKISSIVPGLESQVKADMDAEDSSECTLEMGLAENSLFKVSHLETTSNVMLNSGNMLVAEALPVDNEEGETQVMEAQPNICKQIGRERRRRKQSLEELRLPEEFMRVEVLPVQEENPVKKKRRYRKRDRVLTVGVKKELESVEENSNCSGSLTAIDKLKKNESKELEINRSKVTITKDSQTVEGVHLEVQNKAASSSQSSCTEDSNVTKQKEDPAVYKMLPEKQLPTSDKINGNTRETVYQHPKKKLLTDIKTEEDSAIRKGAAFTHPKKKLLLARNEESDNETESQPAVDPEESNSHPGIELFRQLSSEGPKMLEERKSKRILERAKSLEESLLHTDSSKKSIKIEHGDQQYTTVSKQHTKVDQQLISAPIAPCSSGLGSGGMAQSAKKLRSNYRKTETMLLEKISKQNASGTEEEEKVKINVNKEIINSKMDKTAKPLNLHLEPETVKEPQQCKILESMKKEGSSETAVQKKILKIKAKDSEESSVNEQLARKDDAVEVSIESLASSLKASSPKEKKEHRTARIIRELRKRVNPHFRKQGLLDSKLSGASKKQNSKTIHSSAKKQKPLKNTERETKTDKDNIGLKGKSIAITRSKSKEKLEQNSKKLRRSARQYIRAKVMKIKMNLRVKPQGSSSDRKSQNIEPLHTRKRTCAVETLQRGMNSVLWKKKKLRDQLTARNKSLGRACRSKLEKKKKKVSLLVREVLQSNLQTQRSDSPEYTVAVPDHHNESVQDCVEETVIKETKVVDTKLSNGSIFNEEFTGNWEGNIDNSLDSDPESMQINANELQNEVNVAHSKNSDKIEVAGFEKETCYKEIKSNNFKEKTAEVKEDNDMLRKETFGTDNIQKETAECEIDEVNCRDEYLKIGVDDSFSLTLEENGVNSNVAKKKTVEIDSVEKIETDLETHGLEFDASVLKEEIAYKKINVDIFKKQPNDTEEELSTKWQSEKLSSNEIESSMSNSSKTNETKPDPPKKKFFKHREPGQMRHKRFTRIFNIGEDDEELFESMVKTEKPTTSTLEGPIRDTEEYLIYGKRSLEMTDSHELPVATTENIERPLQDENHMLDIRINLPDIPNMTFTTPAERKWPLTAKEMKCYVGKRRRPSDEAKYEDEEELMEIKEGPQEELEFQSSRWPETTRKRCYPGKRAPKPPEYRPVWSSQKRFLEMPSCRTYGKRKSVDFSEDSLGTDLTLLQNHGGSPKIFSECGTGENDEHKKDSKVHCLLPMQERADDEKVAKKSQNAKPEVQTSKLSVKEHLRPQVESSHSEKKETVRENSSVQISKAEEEKDERQSHLPVNVRDPVSDVVERRRPMQQSCVGVRGTYRNLTSQIVSSKEIVREILERSRVRSTAIAMAMNKRVAEAVDRSFSKRLNASLARLPMPSGPEDLEAALQASAATKLKLLPQDKEHVWHIDLPKVIGSSATTTVATVKLSSSSTGNKSGTRSNSGATSTRGLQGSSLYLGKEAERAIALRQLETLPTRCRSSRRQRTVASTTKMTKPKKLDWCKQRSRRKQPK